MSKVIIFKYIHQVLWESKTLWRWRNVLCVSLATLALYYCVTTSDYYNRQDLDRELRVRRLTIPIYRWSRDGPTEQLPAGVTNRRIFFHETSGRGHLTFRQVCTVESAARHNAGRLVQVS